MYPEGETDEPGHPQEAENGGHHQAAGASYYKPQQRPKNLAAIQRIDGQHVENEQDHVNHEDRSR
jgi:hypothetical protein